jgi:hypothetical protein
MNFKLHLFKEHQALQNTIFSLIFLLSRPVDCIESEFNPDPDPIQIRI